MIVLDNSVLIPLFTDHARTSAAERLITVDDYWRLPAIWQFEFTNVISTFVRKGRLDLLKAFQAIDDAQVAVGKTAVAVDQHRVVRFSKLYNISGYDAQYVALADEYGIVVITDDRQLALRAKQHVILLDDFLSMHR